MTATDWALVLEPTTQGGHPRWSMNRNHASVACVATSASERP